MAVNLNEAVLCVSKSRGQRPRPIDTPAEGNITGRSPVQADLGQLTPYTPMYQQFSPEARQLPASTSGRGAWPATQPCCNQLRRHAHCHAHVAAQQRQRGQKHRHHSSTSPSAGGVNAEVLRSTFAAEQGASRDWDAPAQGFNSIPEALDDLKSGKFVVVLDDENRENEGDLIMAAEHMTPEVNILLNSVGLSGQASLHAGHCGAGVAAGLPELV